MSSRKMKDSGIEWIGEIPEEWEVRKLKYATICNGETLSESTKSDYTFDYIDIGSVLYEGGITNTLEVTFETAPSRARRVVHENDVIISTVRTYLKAIAYIDKKYESAICSTGFAVFSPKKGYDGRFLYYSLSANWFVSSVESISTGISYPAVSSIAMGDLKSIFPPFSQQKAIAGYLDKKCAAIDQIVVSKQKQNEQLAAYRQSLVTEAVTKGLNPAAPMKDSDIEWIGEIPEKWEISKIKHLLSTPITDGPHETPEILEEGIPFISAEAVKNLKVNFELKRGFISQIDHERFCKKCKPQFGDIFMVKSGATTGNIARVDTHEEFSIWSPLALIRVKNTVIKRDYMFYFLQSNLFRLQVELFWSYGTQQNIGMEVLENLYAPYPSLGMQQKIAAYLDKKCGEIDALSGRNKNIIESLQEYKQSLIYEAVTGKIEL